MLLQQRLNLLRAPQMMIHLARLSLPHRRKLNLLAAQLRRVHRLAQHLHRQPTRLLQVALLLVVLLEQRLGAGVVGADAGRLPAAVVAARVALVQLELALVVVAGVDEGDAEGAEAAVLRVALLEVA